MKTIIMERVSIRNMKNYMYGETQYEMLAREMEQNFYETMKSIEKYGGYYIGRYETGLEGRNKNNRDKIEGKRGIPLYYKVYEYNDTRNKSMEDVKEGIKIVKELLEPYRYDVTILADRGFASINLFEYINQLGWKYYIRTKGGTKVYIENDEVIGKLQEIEHPRGHTRFFYNVELTSNKYKCNIASKPSGKTEEVSLQEMVEIMN